MANCGRPSELRPLPRSLPDPERAHQVANLDLGHTLRPDIEQRTAVRTFLAEVPDVDEIGVPEFLSLAAAPTRDSRSRLLRVPRRHGARRPARRSWRS